jgi:predicted acetyltransferase
MSQLTIRPYEDRDQEGFYSVTSLTYNNGIEVAPERREHSLGGRFVAEEGGEIAGIFSTLDIKATRGAALYNCAGVAGVGVSPDRRRSGVGLAMMRWSVNHFRKTGQTLAALYAFREPFYAKSGYAVCGKRVRISVPVHRLPKLRSDLKIRRLTPQDWALLQDCHATFAHARSGVNIRNEALWQRVLAEVKPLAIYAAGDPVEGYVAVNHRVAFWEEQWLSELVWSTRAGYEACIALLHQLGINKTSVAWYEPSDSPYYAHFLDQGVSAELSRPAMYRVCDVPGAMRGLHTGYRGAFTIAVQDPDILENCGTFHVEFTPQGVEVIAMPDKQADLEMTIGAFTQAFLGEPSLDELAGYGAVTVRSREALESAVLLMPHLPVFCSDFF